MTKYLLVSYFFLDLHPVNEYTYFARAGVAELADARDSNSRVLTDLWVRFPPSALYPFTPGTGRAGCTSLYRDRKTRDDWARVFDSERRSTGQFTSTAELPACDSKPIEMLGWTSVAVESKPNHRRVRFLHPHPPGCYCGTPGRCTIALRQDGRYGSPWSHD
jgi:hypothetical protein